MRKPVFYLVAWLLCIFVATPFARRILSALRGVVGESGIIWLICGSALVSAIALVSRNSGFKFSRAALCSACVLLAGFIIATYALRRRPEEVVHLVEYGVLSFLVLNVLKRESPTLPLHLSAIALTASVGVLEELYQWALPSRVFDYRDIAVNLFAATIVQSSLFFGAWHDLRARVFAGSDISVLVQSVHLFFSLIFVCLLLTPSTISRIVTAFPTLSYLTDEAVTDFGFDAVTAHGIRFRSHFTKDGRSLADEARGDEVSERISRGFNSKEEGSALPADTKDPFLHEAVIHLVRRDIYLQRFNDDSTRKGAARIALGEERILRDSYSRSTRLQRLPDADMDKLKSVTGENFTYTSPVAKHLFTKFNQSILQLFFCGIIIFLSVFSLLLRNRRNDSASKNFLAG